MRRASSLPLPAPPDRAFRGDWHTVRTLLPYLLAYKGRVFLALACLVAAKLANVGVPLVLKQIVDRLTAPAELVLPLALLAVFLVVGEQIRWNVLLPGLAWRAWLLLYLLPAGITAWETNRAARHPRVSAGSSDEMDRAS